MKKKFQSSIFVAARYTSGQLSQSAGLNLTGMLSKHTLIHPIGNKLKQLSSIEEKLQYIRPQNLALVVTVFMICFFQALPVYAHRTSSEVLDSCQIQVGAERVHFTAYTPTFTKNKEYCKAIPNIGPTNLVFDYEGKQLRHISVEFEVTKEPEGTRVFYQEPKKIVTGTVNGLVNFSKYGPGDYLAHITIVDKDDKLDTHLPFTVGFEEESEGFFSGSSFGKVLLFATVTLAVSYFLMLMYRAKREDTTS